jgi:predicted Zn-dependent protease
MRYFLLITVLSLFVLSGPAAQNKGKNGGLNGFDMGDINNSFSGMGTSSAKSSDNTVTPQDAYYLGRAVGANLLTRYKPYTQKPALTQYVNEVCASLLVNTPITDLYGGCHVLILDSPNLNAITSSGGHIFIYRGLIEAVKSEEELAAVLAHEIAHLQKRHSIEAVEKARLESGLNDIVNEGLTAIARNVSVKERRQLLDQSVSTLMDQLLAEGYSVEQEYAADQAALDILAAAGYPPSSLASVLTILQKQGHTGGKTHPMTSTRISRVQRAGNRDPKPDYRSARAARFAAAIK